MQAAEKAAAAGFRLDIDRVEDIQLGWAAFRLTKTGGEYKEVEPGAKGAFAIWVIPVYIPTE